MNFDPNAPANRDGIFGLPFTTDDAAYVVIPVPFDATTSYRDGARQGPAAVLAASRQVDLFDLDFGRFWAEGIAMLPHDRGPARKVAGLNREARRLALPVIAAGGEVAGRPALQRALREVNRRSLAMCGIVEAQVQRLLELGKVPVVLGGDHSTPFGCVKACAQRHPGMGVLHVDAHADLRPAFEGFEWSHASIMHNVTVRIGARGGVAALVQVGVRDLGENEYEEICRKKRRDETRIVTYFDSALQGAKHRGETWAGICANIVSKLPRDVYLSVDIDGLDAALCPDTGTPVPGGLSFAEFVELLHALVRGRRRIVGMDLSEVAPKAGVAASAWGADWNANVGARTLYKMIGAAARCGDRARTRGGRSA